MAYGGGAAAAMAAIAQAVKASGAIVKMEPGDFQAILARVDNPLVVVASGGILDRGFKYLVSYRGLVFYTKSKIELSLPGKVEVVRAGSIWIPG